LGSRATRELYGRAGAPETERGRGASVGPIFFSVWLVSTYSTEHSQLDSSSGWNLRSAFRSLRFSLFLLQEPSRGPTEPPQSAPDVPLWALAALPSAEAECSNPVPRCARPSNTGSSIRREHLWPTCLHRPWAGVGHERIVVQRAGTIAVYMRCRHATHVFVIAFHVDLHLKYGYEDTNAVARLQRRNSRVSGWHGNGRVDFEHLST
jgi:hypothetical protein